MRAPTLPRPLGERRLPTPGEIVLRPNVDGFSPPPRLNGARTPPPRFGAVRIPLPKLDGIRTPPLMLGEARNVPMEGAVRILPPLNPPEWAPLNPPVYMPP